MDITLLNIAFLACQRASVETQLAAVPPKERKTYEELKHYTARHKPTPNIAWTDALNGASAWLTDREIDRVEREKSSSGHVDSQGFGDF